jgi:aminopeptidase N
MKNCLLALSGWLTLTSHVMAVAQEPAAAGRVSLPTDVVPSHYDLDIDLGHAADHFSGTARITLQVTRPTSDISLNVADLEIRHFSVSTPESGTVLGSPHDIHIDTTRQTATLHFPAPVAKGQHVLRLEYTGKIHDTTNGLFGLAYTTVAGPKRALFTQFEPADARSFLPCWDEPALKATFTLGVTVPAADLTVSNMPIAASQVLPNGTKHIQFATTPRMSTYLLFFGSGDLQRISRKVDGVDIGVVVKRGDTPKAHYALDVAAQVLPYYEKYFGLKYPLPKLDLVAGPGDSQFFAAMENWGAIFYLEKALESDPTVSTDADRERVYLTVAHEMAHQWFGDLVTLSWWDELWLNEGFAEWMTGKVTAHFHPEWHIPLEAMRLIESAMMSDARLGTHAIVHPIHDVHEASQVFDSITYDKGLAVINMLESAAGEGAFRAGVQQYIRKHAYGNTVSDDLWAEIDKVAPQPLSATAHDFTLQPGVPLIRVSDGPKTIELHQERFALDASGDQPTTWHVPVSERSLDTGHPWNGAVTRDRPVSLNNTGGTILVNVSHAGYFRTLYSPTLFGSLTAHFNNLPAEDQAGLLNDTQSLSYSGFQPLTDFLELTLQTRPDSHTTVLRLVSDDLRDLDTRLDGLPVQPRLRLYARSLLGPIYSRLGWETAASDPLDIRQLRASLLATLSQVEDPAVLTEARHRFNQLCATPEAFTPEMRMSVLAVVAENADAATWDQLHDMARNAGSFLEKAQLYKTLGAPRDPQLAQRALQLSLTNELDVTLRPELIKAVAQAHFPDAAFEFVAAHFQQVDTMLEPSGRSRFAPELLARSGNAAMLDKLQAYTEAHIPTGERNESVATAAAIAYNAKIRSQQLTALDQWLQTALEKLARGD